MGAGPLVLVLAVCLSAQEQEQEQQLKFFEEEESSHVELKTVWDFRYISADSTTSWLDASLGKARYGGDGVERRHLFRISQASVVFDTRPASSLTTHVQVNIDLEPEHPGGRYGWDRVRLVEAFADWRWTFAEPTELRVKGGMFFPPISLEHIGEAWTTFYTVTPSAINAWVGEDVRVTGAEAAAAHVGVANEVAAKAALIWNNDPTGSLLAYRGFAIHDRQTGYRDRVPLPPTPSLEPRGTFATQAPFVEPLVEIDDRLGYYGALSWRNYPHFEANALYFDNRGIPTVFDGEQYAWQTRFANIGAATWFLPAEMEVLGQLMSGETFMGFRGPGAPKMTADFRSWYLMWSAPWGRNRFTVRYEDFRVWDRDHLVEPDGSNETGNAWTFAYLVRIAGRHRVGFELLRIDSTRPARTSLGLPAAAEELQFQLSLRLEF